LLGHELPAISTNKRSQPESEEIPKRILRDGKRAIDVGGCRDTTDVITLTRVEG
jgi:hypothetical protein